MQQPPRILPRLIAASGPLFLLVGITLIIGATYTFFTDIQTQIIKNSHRSTKVIFTTIIPAYIAGMIIFNYIACVLKGTGTSNTNTIQHTHIATSRGRNRSTSSTDDNTDTSQIQGMTCLKCKSGRYHAMKSMPIDSFRWMLQAAANASLLDMQQVKLVKLVCAWLNQG